MFEHVKKDVIPIEYFLKRLLRYVFIATAMLLFGLFPGILGFLLIGDLVLIEATINALSLLGGLEPPYELASHGGRIFMAIYSFFIETVFFLAFATLLAPIVHRFLHKMHVQIEE
ncbi:TPA: hypothetical protein NJZ01_004595 [Vibrio parahaemolyticus]|nr:hypothetical protein [Vibrio parahaemolyticus]